MWNRPAEASQNPSRFAQSDNKYRPEIDGLRAIAVLAVIINHFNRDAMHLGYLGVDIFFVISGFVITSSIFNRNKGDLFKFWSEFYARRFKRIFPALAACVLVTGFLICLVNADPVASLRIGLSSLFGLSNIYLFKQATDYFGTWAEINMFTHTWSLGVEEQFYLLFPFVVWLTRFRRAPISFSLLVGIASAISLIFYIFIAPTNQPESFFLLPSRLWELGLGVLLYSATATGSLAWRIARMAPASLVLAALVGFLFLKTEAEVPTTIAVAGLSAVLIASLRPRTPAYQLLTLPTMSYLGKISYSLYLWHWGVICLARWTVGLSWWLAPVLFGITIALAATSYHFLEVPLRRLKWSNSQLRSFAYGLAALTVVAGVVLLLQGPAHKYLYTGKSQVVEALARPSQMAVRAANGTLLILGDSHAGQYSSLAADVSAKFHLRYAVISNGATAFPTAIVSTPSGGLTLKKTLGNAAEADARVKQAVADLNPHETNLIVLSSFYRFYFETPLGERKNEVMTHYDAVGRRISAQNSLNIWLEKLKAFAAQNRSTRIVIFLSTPEMPNIYPEMLCQKEWFRPKPSDQCHTQVDRRETVAMLARLNSRIIQAVGASPNISIFDPMPALCPEGQAVCRSDDGGIRLYLDEDHLTKAGSERVAAAFLDYLERTGLAPK
jgi:peptidoglycan/LPS O-acetylase OafA/YrhL